MTQVSVAPQQLPLIASAQAATLPDAAADPAADAGADFASVLRAQIAMPANAALEAEIIAAQLPPGAAEAAEEVPADEASASLAPDLAGLLPILAGLLPTQKAAPAEPQAQLAGVAASQPLPAAAAQAGIMEAPLPAAPLPQAAAQGQPLPAAASEANPVQAPLNAAAEAGTVQAPLNAAPLNAAPLNAAPLNAAAQGQPLPAAAAVSNPVQAPLNAAAEAGTVQAPLNAAAQGQPLPAAAAVSNPVQAPLNAAAEAGTVQAPLSAAPPQQAAPRRSQPLPAATAEAGTVQAPLNASLSSPKIDVAPDGRPALTPPAPAARSPEVSIRQAPAEALPTTQNSTAQQMLSAAEQAGPAPAGQAAPAAFAHAASAYETTEVVRIDTPVGSRGWDNEMAQKVVILVGRQESRAELTLTPPQLGRVEVTITVQGDQTSAAFVSASPAAREALEQALPRLREILAEAGITLGQASVNAESPRQGRDDPATTARGDSPVREAARDSDAPVQRVRRSNGLIDTFA